MSSTSSSTTTTSIVLLLVVEVVVVALVLVVVVAVVIVRLSQSPRIWQSKSHTVALYSNSKRYWLYVIVTLTVTANAAVWVSV